MTMLPSVRELLAFADHTANLQSQKSAAPQFVPKTAAEPAAGLGCASRQTSEAAEPIVFPCSTRQHTNSNNNEQIAAAAAIDSPQQEAEATVKQRPGRKARSGGRYSSSSGARQYKCGLQCCLAVFKRPEHLKRHMLTHTQARPFLCEALNCGKRFSRRDNYITHMKKHEPEDFPQSFVSESVSRSSSRCSDGSSIKFRRTDEMVDAAVSSFSASCSKQVPTGVSSIQALLNEDSDHESEHRVGRRRKAQNIASSDYGLYGSNSPGLVSSGYSSSRQPAQSPLPPLELLAHASTRKAAPPSASKQSSDTTAITQYQSATSNNDQPTVVALGLAPTQAIRVSLSTESPLPSSNNTHTATDSMVMDEDTQHAQKQKMDLSAVSSSFLFAAGDPSKPFMCSICESRFGRLEHVRRHHLVHTGQRKYECPTCNKTFARKDNMVQHMRAHERKK
ncbi:hypothetical protein H4R99_002069 [Coemansia sp. RSA 1722]|nr:hypothetical protein LPJ57_006434 [Coemansia sp. RSA 486]KAJ2604020.1 hypothetical protein H4R99_002069 [Coemansia sp. RSA 1722]